MYFKRYGFSQFRIFLFVVSVVLGRTVEAKNPYMIYVHGGAWVSGSPTQYTKLSEALTARGFCVVLAKYSLAPVAKHPTPVKELNEIVGATAADTKSKDCDPARIYLVGHSAGAHMIAFWNTLFVNPAVKGFIGIEGIYDLPLLLKTWPAYEAQFIGLEFGKERESASPAKIPVKSKTPWLLVHSKDDELVDEAQTRSFEKHLMSEKVVVQTTLISGRHFEVIGQLEKKDSPISKALQDFVTGKK